MEPCRDMWERLEQLVDGALSRQALRAHGMHLFAARYWRGLGRPVSSDLRRDERRAAMLSLAAPLLLERVRAAYGGRLMLMKGPEVAACYADPNTRYYRDLDLLADDPHEAQRALVSCGFVEGGQSETYEDAQHLRPLAWPGLPLIVEIHRRPNCPSWLTPPPLDELAELAIPSRTGIDGLLAPAPAPHALLLAAHSWAHSPLARLRDLVDVMVVLGCRDRELAAELARDWGWEGMWTTTLSAGDAILAGGPRPAWLSLWARHLQPIRERTVLEDHVARVAAPVCAMRSRGATRSVTVGLAQVAGRAPGESWGVKLRRSRSALAHAFMNHSEHERTLEPRLRRRDVAAAD
jgi:Uncharacterised nucleotidyltransferase